MYRTTKRIRTEKPTPASRLSLTDLEIPVEKLLRHEEEIRLGRRIQATFRRLRTLIPLTMEGRRLYLEQMGRVSVGSQVVVQWFPLREGLPEDLKIASRALARARELASEEEAVSANPDPGACRRIDVALERASRIFRRYPLDVETLFCWARVIEDRGERRDDPLELSPRNRRIVRIVRRCAAILEASRDRLVLPNLRLVLKDVFRFNPTGMKRSDLFQEGILGLHRAVFRYDTAKKTRFSTYATYWIRQSIRKALIDRSRLIRVPQAVQEELRSPTPKIDPDEARRVRRVMSEAVSMSASDESDSRDQVSFEALQSRPIHDERLHLGVIPGAVEKALGSLDIREREVVRRRYGIGGDRVQTLEEIGVALHLSRERIRQIEREALAKMKKGRELEAAYEELN